MSSVAQLFLTFVKLGCTSFGGPIAHLGYFHNEFVRRRQWLSESQYANLVALCQFLPGPASSQVGMAIGHLRAGHTGAIAAWLGFTLPSAVLMIAAALSLTAHPDWMRSELIHGLKIAAAVIVAQAVISMYRTLCKDNWQRWLAAVAAALMLLVPVLPTIGWSAAMMQLPVLAIGWVVGMWRSRRMPSKAIQGMNWSFLLVFAVLLVLAVFSAHWLAGFYRAGALVFGGGHVLLPMLESTTSEWIDADRFMAGYGLAQAMPGPLFSFAGYLGTSMQGTVAAGVLALIVIFLPSYLLLIGVLPAWHAFAASPKAQAILGGVNAVVVGILFAAWVDPVASSALRSPVDVLIAIAGFVALQGLKAPAWAIVVFCAVAASL